MSYAIFRVEPINKLSDLAQIGSHNKREKKAYKSNPDLNAKLVADNIAAQIAARAPFRSAQKRAIRNTKN